MECYRIPNEIIMEVLCIETEEELITRYRDYQVIDRLYARKFDAIENFKFSKYLDDQPIPKRKEHLAALKAWGIKIGMATRWMELHEPDPFISIGEIAKI